MTLQQTGQQLRNQCVAFSKELKRLRRTKGITQVDLARFLAVKPSYLSAIECLRRPAPAAEVIDRVREALSLTESESELLQRVADNARRSWKHLLLLKAEAQDTNECSGMLLSLDIDGRRIDIPVTSPDIRLKLSSRACMEAAM